MRSLSVPHRIDRQDVRLAGSRRASVNDPVSIRLKQAILGITQAHQIYPTGTSMSLPESSLDRSSTDSILRQQSDA